jgi:acyl-CoA thioesterase
MITSRLTVDILGTVPMAPLAPVLRVIRDGQRMQMAEVEFYAAGRLWVRATAMRARIAETAERATPLTRRHPIDSDPLEQYPWFESRHVDCDRKRVGPGAIWARFKADVVANEPLAPLSVMAMIADFGSGTAPLMHLQEWTLANLDITVYLTRMPVSEWLLVDAESEGAGHGSGVSSARIGDARGMFARSLQSVFIDRR